MAKIKNRPRINSRPMFNQKTNEDFHKKKPNPTDPKVAPPVIAPEPGEDPDAIEKGRRTTIIPDFSDPVLKPLDSETPDETGNWEKAANTADGSE